LIALVQIKHLQIDLASHPRSNRLIALQSSLANLFELLRHVMTLVLSSAETFKWTVAVTMASHVVSLCFYTTYLRLTRS
jgi:iron-regulated transporter 1